MCDTFLKDTPQVVRTCGFSDILPYCCSDEHVTTLKAFRDDFQIVCEDTPEQSDRISLVKNNVDRLAVECSKGVTLPDDYKTEPTPKSESTLRLDFNLINIFYSMLLMLLAY